MRLAVVVVVGAAILTTLTYVYITDPDILRLLALFVAAPVVLLYIADEASFKRTIPTEQPKEQDQ